MLITTAQSEAKKTAGCAVTYRAAESNPYGVCPSACPLMPEQGVGSKRVDESYLETLLGAVPKAGSAFTYTHYHPRHWEPAWQARKATYRPITVVNFSCDSVAQAAAIKRRWDIPLVLAVPAPVVARWGGGHWRQAYYGSLRIVRCPAEWCASVTCASCGGAKSGGIPLCARSDRTYAIGFSAHGSEAAKVGSKAPGGCYAAGGNVGFHWRELASREATQSDSEALRAFVDTLPAYAVLRHHVAGDIGGSS